MNVCNESYIGWVYRSTEAANPYFVMQRRRRGGGGIAGLLVGTMDAILDSRVRLTGLDFNYCI